MTDAHFNLNLAKQSAQFSEATSSPGFQAQHFTTELVTNHTEEAVPTLKVIIITHTRTESLLRCMKAVHEAYYDGGRIDLLIFIDRGLDENVNQNVLSAAINFPWIHGAKFVNTWNSHVGLYEQWIDSFIPEREDDLAIILEDDIEVSPYFYKWLLGACRMYRDRKDIFGYTLQKGTVRANQTKCKRNINVPSKEPLFLYPLIGSWGYAPEPKVWIQFRKWFHLHICNESFNPSVPGLIVSSWYKAQKTRKTMWTMWHIRYAHDRNLFTIYANLPNLKTLGSNWRDPGLRYGKGSSVAGRIDFERFDFSDFISQNQQFIYPPRPITLDWKEAYIDRTGKRNNC